VGNEVWLGEEGRGGLMRIRGIGGGRLDGLRLRITVLVIHVVLS
jgi:hypothetical protein